MEDTKAKSEACLRWAGRNGQPAEFALDRDIVLVGRDDGVDIRIDDPLVSRAHARVERRGRSFFVIDLGSTNYTKVNGTVVAHHELKHGDEVTFGRTCCRFLQEDPRGPAAEA